MIVPEVALQVEHFLSSGHVRGVVNPIASHNAAGWTKVKTLKYRPYFSTEL